MNFLIKIGEGFCFGAGLILVSAAFSAAFHLSLLGACVVR